MDEVHALGGKISDLAGQFGESKTKLNEIVTGITQSDFTSDDAVAIAEKIRSYNPLLNEIQDRLDAFGNYGSQASNIVSQVNEEIKDKIASNI
jgi:hypothetical protein